MEDVLERHRSKLQEHRQFLQNYKTASVDGKVDTARGSTSPDADPGMHTVNSTQLTDHSLDGAPSPAARAPPSTGTRSEQENGVDAPIYLAEPSASRKAATAAAATAGARPDANNGVQNVDELLRSRGRYTSSQPPDAMYVKSQAWLRRRDWQTDAARRAQEDEEKEACTFAPRLSSVDAARAYTNVEDEIWIDSAIEKRHARVRGGADDNGALVGDADGGEGSPSQSGSRARQAQQRQPTIGILSDPAVVKHMMRQEAARRRKVDDEKRVRGVDIDKWRNQTTKPQPFHLGVRPGEPIPSLRKPYVGGLEKEHYDPSAFMGNEELSVVDLLKAQVRQRDLVIDDQEREILYLQQELREVKAMLVQLTGQRKTEPEKQANGESRE